MKTLLKVLFTGVFLCMVTVTVRAGLEKSLWAAWPDFAANPSAVATLCDACFGLLTFSVWLACRESRTWSRILWSVLITCVGNIAMSLRVLPGMFRLKPHEPAWALLRRPAE